MLRYSSYSWYGIQGLAEHLLVFWASPMLASLFGAWAYLGFKHWQQLRRKAAARKQQRAKKTSGHVKTE